MRALPAFSNSEYENHNTDTDLDNSNGGSRDVSPDINLVNAVLPELLSMNRPLNDVTLPQKRSRSSCTLNHHSQDNIIISSTPPPHSSTRERQHAGQFCDQRHEQNSLQRREFCMRDDQTAVPYLRRRSELSTRQKAPASMPQPHSEDEVSEPLHNITNNIPKQRTPASKKRGQKTGQWTDEQLKKAIEAIKGGMRIHSASELYKIPHSSLRDHLYGVTVGRKRGGEAVFNPTEEEQIVQWITRLQDLGHPITTTALRMKVADICQEREIPFADGIPGRGRLRWWRRRHPELSLRCRVEKSSFRKILGF